MTFLQRSFFLSKGCDRPPQFPQHRQQHTQIPQSGKKTNIKIKMSKMAMRPANFRASELAFSLSFSKFILIEPPPSETVMICSKSVNWKQDYLEIFLEYILFISLHSQYSEWYNLHLDEGTFFKYFNIFVVI